MAFGQVIGNRYRLESFLGQGGTATVHLARDLETRGPVVIKRMTADVAQQAELRSRFVQEARTLSRIDHPLVVRALDVQEPDDEPPFLVLEALGGETVGDYLRRESVLPVELALKVARDAGRALSAVHEAGVVHRDIKPDNLFLVGPIGAPRCVKVLDFGMAHSLEDEELHGQDAEPTSILGTAQYMAPEQILVESVDARTDIYGLGVVLFRMLTGHLPFDVRNKEDLLRHQLFSPVPPVSWLDECLSDELTRVVRRATQKRPSQRHASMNEFLAELQTTILDEDAADESERASGIALVATPGLPDLDWRDYESDVYEPQTERGRIAAEILARKFGVYSRPHSPQPPTAD